MLSYFDEFQGRFIGIMQWEDCHLLLQNLIDKPDNWYVYDTLDKVPTQTTDSTQFISQINSIKEILTNEHQERYCGIVYTNDLEKPSFVKIFHPNNLGKTCGGSDNPPIPKWLLSKTSPEDVIEKFGPIKKEGFVSKILKL